MRKNSSGKIWGILVLVMVFGLGLVLTGCELEPDTVDISVRNDSSSAIRVEIVRRHEGRDTAVWWNNVQPGATINRHYAAGYFSVRVGFVGSTGFPFVHPMPTGQFRRMSGQVNLTFDGTRVH